MQGFRNSSVQNFIAIVLIYALAGCTTTASYTDSTLDTAIDDLRPGARILVYTVQGQVYEVEVAEVSSDSILTKNRAIDRQDIVKIELKKRSAVKTTAAVAGGTLVGILAVLGALLLYDVSTPDD